MNIDRIKIKKTTAEDYNDIMRVEELAFGSNAEALLTAALLKDRTAEPVLSLLAYMGDDAVGHILFTRVCLDRTDSPPLLHILAPLAVVPDAQRQGLGGILIEEGIRRLREMGSEMVFVLGHIDYYSKHGFIPGAARLGFSAPFPISSEVSDAWMVQSLTSRGLLERKGKVFCADELNKAELWRE